MVVLNLSSLIYLNLNILITKLLIVLDLLSYYQTINILYFYFYILYFANQKCFQSDPLFLIDFVLHLP